MSALPSTKAAASRNLDVPHANISNFEMKIIVRGIADDPQKIAKEAFDVVVEHYPRMIDHEINVMVFDDTYFDHHHHVGYIIGRPKTP